MNDEDLKVWNLLQKFWGKEDFKVVPLGEIKTWNKEDLKTLKELIEEGIIACSDDQLFLTERGLQVYYNLKALHQIDQLLSK